MGGLMLSSRWGARDAGRADGEPSQGLCGYGDECRHVSGGQVMGLQGEDQERLLSSVCISHTEWNATLESYVVHTNYDEYAIFLTKKFSHRHGPTITAKLYGKGPNNDSVGARVGPGWCRD